MGLILSRVRRIFLWIFYEIYPRNRMVAQPNQRQALPADIDDLDPHLEELARIQREFPFVNPFLIVYDNAFGFDRLVEIHLSSLDRRRG